MKNLFQLKWLFVFSLFTNAAFADRVQFYFQGPNTSSTQVRRIFRENAAHISHIRGSELDGGEINEGGFFEINSEVAANVQRSLEGVGVIAERVDDLFTIASQPRPAITQTTLNVEQAERLLESLDSPRFSEQLSSALSLFRMVSQNQSLSTLPLELRSQIFDKIVEIERKINGVFWVLNNNNELLQVPARRNLEPLRSTIANLTEIVDRARVPSSEASVMRMASHGNYAGINVIRNNHNRYIAHWINWVRSHMNDTVRFFDGEESRGDLRANATTAARRSVAVSSIHNPKYPYITALVPNSPMVLLSYLSNYQELPMIRALTTLILSSEFRMARINQGQNELFGENATTYHGHLALDQLILGMANFPTRDVPGINRATHYEQVLRIFNRVLDFAQTSALREIIVTGANNVLSNIEANPSLLRNFQLASQVRRIRSRLTQTWVAPPDCGPLTRRLLTGQGMERD